MSPAIHQLAERPDWLPVVAAWIYNQWWAHVPEANPDTLSSWFEAHLVRDQLPLTLVASLEDLPVGTATLLDHDVGTEHWPEFSPWLAAVYVVPERRHRGVGAALVNAAAATAATLGVETLYLLTSEREDFYVRLGWEKIDQKGSDVIMSLRPVAEGEEAV